MTEIPLWVVIMFGVFVGSTLAFLVYLVATLIRIAHAGTDWMARNDVRSLATPSSQEEGTAGDDKPVKSMWGDVHALRAEQIRRAREGRQ